MDPKAPYEKPQHPELTLDTVKSSIDETVNCVIGFLTKEVRTRHFWPRACSVVLVVTFHVLSLLLVISHNFGLFDYVFWNSLFQFSPSNLWVRPLYIYKTLEVKWCILIFASGWTFLWQMGPNHESWCYQARVLGLEFRQDRAAAAKIAISAAA